MKYLLNSAVITAPGLYRYSHCGVESATRWLREGHWVSTIGYPETAAALEALTGVRVPTDRRVIAMEPNDEALVFRLMLPPGSARVAPGAKGALGRDFILQHCELGYLKRIP